MAGNNSGQGTDKKQEKRLTTFFNNKQVRCTANKNFRGLATAIASPRKFLCERSEFLCMLSSKDKTTIWIALQISVKNQHLSAKLTNQTMEQNL